MDKDIKLTRGDTPTYLLTITRGLNPDGSKKLLDLTGATLEFTARDATGVVISKDTDTVGSGLTITNAPTGAVSLKFLAADTTGMPPRLSKYDYDVELREPGGNVTTVLQGRLYVRADQTV